MIVLETQCSSADLNINVNAITTIVIIIIVIMYIMHTAYYDHIITAVVVQ